MSATGGRFVFLSHNSLDKPAVERLAGALLDHGIRPWLDKWDLRPGRPWQAEIERALGGAEAVLVCIGAHGLGRVQEPELQVAQDRAWRDRERLVIPVLLPEAPEQVEEAVPDFLRQRTWSDLRGPGAEAEMARLVAALDGRALGPVLPASLPCPYPGLAAFTEEEASRFFGREVAVTTALTRLYEGRRLLTLVGASGAGKSSLLMAGILPALRTGELDGTYSWQVVRLRPGARPIHQLAVQLTALRGGSPKELMALREALQGAPEALSDQVDLMFASQPKATRMVVAVDQFEEVFTTTENEAERRAFLAALLHAATVAGGRVTVLLTLRADFLGRALEESGALAEAIKASLELVLSMTSAELQAAIERPALLARLRFDDGLVDALVKEVAGQPGDLPLLQFTLEGLCRESEGRCLSWTAYRRLGGLRGAISQRADWVLASLEEAEQALVRRVFGRMVRLGEGTLDTRRRAPWAELESLDPGAGPLLDRLIHERLLSADEHGIEMAHEALLCEWPALRGWVKADREALRLQLAVASGAAQWERAGRLEEDLWRGGRLARAREIHSTGALMLAALERTFLRASADAERTRANEVEAQRQRELEAARALAAARLQSTRRLQWGLGVAVLLFVAVGGVALWALRAQAFAEVQRRQGQESLEKAVEVADLITLMIDLDREPIVGDAHVHIQRDLNRARRAYQATLELLTRLSSKDPANSDWQRDLSISYNKLGDVQLALGDFSSALASYRSALAIAKHLSLQDPDDAGRQRDLSICQERLGDVQLAQGDFPAALASYRSSLATTGHLASQDPDDAGWQRDLSVSHEKLGDLQLAQGDLSGALVLYRSSLAIIERLVAQGPNNADLQWDLVASYWKVAHVVDALTPVGASEAIGQMTQGLEILRKLDAAGQLTKRRQASISSLEAELERLSRPASPR